MCARSVICRSPPCHDSTRSPMPLSCAASKIAATPRSRAWPAHSRSVSATPVGQRVAALDKGLGGLAEEHRRRGGAHHARAVRLVERLQQAQPVLGGLGVEHVGVAGVHRRDAGVGQRVGSRRGRPCGSRRSPRCRAASSGSPSNVAPLASSAPMSAARSCGMCVAQVVDRRCSGFRCGRTSPGCTTRSRNGSSRGAPASRRAVVLRLDLVHDDPRVAELGAAAAPPAVGRPARRRCASWCRVSSRSPAVSAACR